MPLALRWLLQLGPTNPIAVRLIQNASRRTRHLYVRSAYLAVLIVVLLWSLIINAGGGSLSYRELAVGCSRRDFLFPRNSSPFVKLLLLRYFGVQSVVISPCQGPR